MPNAKPRAERADRAQRSIARRGRLPRDASPWADPLDMLSCDAEPPGELTSLHSQRLDTVQEALQAAGVRSVADLGCGDGALVRRLLADAHIERVVALDQDIVQLGRLERSVELAELRSGRRRLVHGSFAAAHGMLAGVEAVAMVETIEHLAPAELSALEHQVFSVVRPALGVITTPGRLEVPLLTVSPPNFSLADRSSPMPPRTVTASASAALIHCRGCLGRVCEDRSHPHPLSPPITPADPPPDRTA